MEFQYSLNKWGFAHENEQLNEVGKKVILNCHSLKNQSYLLNKRKAWLIEIVWRHKFDHANPAIFIKIAILRCITQPQWVNLVERWLKKGFNIIIVYRKS